MDSDTAWRDEDGYFWFVGRTDDVIKSSGYRVDREFKGSKRVEAREPMSGLKGVNALGGRDWFKDPMEWPSTKNKKGYPVSSGDPRSGQGASSPSVRAARGMRRRKRAGLPPGW